MKNYCGLCAFDDKLNYEIVGVCAELKVPVCAEHAKRCDGDGHCTSELPEHLERRRR